MFDKVEDQIQDAFDAYWKRTTILLQAAMKKELKKWKKRFPKRKLHFYDGMGCQGIRVDDIDTYFPGYPWNDERIQRLFKPLHDLVTWYCKTADRYHIEIDDIEM